jgi:hypothetical protein
VPALARGPACSLARPICALMPARLATTPDVFVRDLRVESARSWGRRRLFCPDHGFVASGGEPGGDFNDLDSISLLPSTLSHLFVRFKTSLVQLQLQQQRRQASSSFLAQTLTWRPAHLLQQMHSHARGDWFRVDELILPRPRLPTRSEFLRCQRSNVGAAEELSWSVL